MTGTILICLISIVNFITVRKVARVIGLEAIHVNVK